MDGHAPAGVFLVLWLDASASKLAEAPAWGQFWSCPDLALQEPPLGYPKRHAIDGGPEEWRVEGAGRSLGAAGKKST